MSGLSESGRLVGQRMGYEAAVTYLDAKWDQLRAAVAAKDSRSAMAVLDSIAADGHPEVVQAIWDAMLDTASHARLAKIFGQQPEDGGAQ